MPHKRSVVATVQNSAMVINDSPLGLADKRLVFDALSETAPEWSVDLAGIRSEEATLILLPETGDDAVGPSFIISREGFGYRLDQCHWDVMNEVGIYAGLGDVMTAVRERIARNAGCQGLDAAALH